MAWFAATLGLVFLSGYTDFSAANKDTCDIYAAVGQSLTLPFVFDGLTNLHVLRWIHNKKIVFYRQQNRVSVGTLSDISGTGSLLLKNLQFSSAGDYQATVLYPNDTLAKSWTGHLCVINKVSKPQLEYSCDFKSSAVNLDCRAPNPQGLVFSWTLDGNTLTSETKQKLSISLTELKRERTFTCSVANKVSKETSDAVHPICKSPTPSPPTVLCFMSKTVVAVLAGGAGLILLLLTIIFILCCCHRRNKTRNKAGVRMLSLSKHEPDSSIPEYETMQPTNDSPPLSPEPSPRACYENVSQPEAQTENRLPEPSIADNGQRPSPVPKPRTKTPKTANI